MKITCLRLLFFILCIVTASESAKAQKYGELRKVNQNSVIFIHSERSNKDGSGARAQSFGTGFIVTEYGHAISANHVVFEDSADTVVTTWASIGSRNSPNKYPVEVVKREPELDLILLQLQIPSSVNTQAAHVGGSATTPLDSDLYALGFPGKSDLSPTTGMLSNRSGPKGRWQTTLGINRGNSGGPVFDPTTRKVVAIAWAGDDSAQQVTYVIPESYASGLLQIAGNGAVAAKVARAILLDDDLKGSKVVVQATKESVMLRGFAGSSFAKTKAAELAAKIDGVRSVENDIQVVVVWDPTDAAITQAVSSKLNLKAASQVAIETTQGTVILSGFAKSAADSANAVANARAVAGVKEVKNALMVKAF